MKFHAVPPPTAVSRSLTKIQTRDVQPIQVMVAIHFLLQTHIYTLLFTWFSLYEVPCFSSSHQPCLVASQKSRLGMLSQYNSPISGGGTTHTVGLSTFLSVFSINTIFLPSSVLSYSFLPESPRIPLLGSLQDECCFQIKISSHI